MKIIVTRNKNIFGKNGQGFKATVSTWEASGATKDEAIFNLNATLEDQKRFNFTRRYYRAKNATFCLYYAGCWCYDIIHDEMNVKTDLIDGYRYPGSCQMPNYTRDQALESMLKHIKQFND